MPKIRLLIEFDGRRFHGWQRQPGLRTVHDELLRALRLVLREDVPSLHASGRTDAGVHARGQVVCFDCSQSPDFHRLKHSVSSILRGELAVLDADLAPPFFHPQRSALAKVYRYTILHRRAPPALDYGRVWHVVRNLDLEKMQMEARVIEGRHDFSSFRGRGCEQASPVKEIFSSEVTLSQPYIYYTVRGSGFLKQMVRNIVGTLVGLGDGRLELKSMQEILDARDRRMAGLTAPACGLCLEKVEYPAD